MLAFDTELTGLDLWHGCRPFFFAFCDGQGELSWVEWPVDPFTRTPQINKQELDEIADKLCSDEIVGHNIQIDLRATELTISDLLPGEYSLDWQWGAIEDSCIAAHCFRNLWGLSLKNLRSILLKIDNHKQELLKQATYKARRICKTKAFIEKHGKWRIADARDPHWPAVHRAPKEKAANIEGWWFMDTWLPKAIATITPEFLPDFEYYEIQQLRHPWETVLKDYALEDVESTIALWWVLKEALQEDGLWDQYQQRRKLIRICYEMEETGLTLLPTIDEEITKYKEKASEHEQRARRSIKTTVLNRNGLNLASPKQLQQLLFTDFALPIQRRTTTGQPSTAADVIQELEVYAKESQYYREQVGEQITNAAAEFLSNLVLSKRNNKSADDLTSYKLWGTTDERTTNTNGRKTGGSNGNSGRHKPQLRSSGNRNDKELARRILRAHTPYNTNGAWRNLHVNINITGTKWTRQSSNSPNLQNVGTGKEAEGFDELLYKLRVVFGPREGEYWIERDYSNLELRLWAYDSGNQVLIDAYERGESPHMIIFRELWPEFDHLTDEEVKEPIPQYKWTKNGTFSIIYGASGYKADITYNKHGAYNKLVRRFPEVSAFSQGLINQVAARGYVETMFGYRLYVPQQEPHKAVSARIQGTAGDIIGLAMSDCREELNKFDDPKMCLQVHDSLIFSSRQEPSERALGIIKDCMERQGEKIGIPTPTDGKLITTNWSEGRKIA